MEKNTKRISELLLVLCMLSLLGFNTWQINRTESKIDRNDIKIDRNDIKIDRNAAKLELLEKRLLRGEYARPK